MQLLGSLGQENLYKKWQAGEPRRVYLQSMICPSNPPIGTRTGNTASAYLANREIFRQTQPRSAGFVNRNDGAATTLLFSETLAEHGWDDVDPQLTCFTADGGLHGNLSSQHSGGVVATFCDAATRFLRDDIDPEVYRHLVLPDDGKVIDEAQLE